MDPSSGGLLTIDELAAVSGTTVRTTRYYAQLGLIPPPERRGRVAYYGDVHRARLEMVRRLQEHGFTLQAVERYLADLPDDATPEDLALRRVMLTSWTPVRSERITRRQLEQQAGRHLDDEDLDFLVSLQSLEPDGSAYLATPSLAVGLELLDMDVSREAVRDAGEAITRHMTSLAAELTGILQDGVVGPYRAGEHSAEESAHMEDTVSRLRRLTLEAVVTGFQRAADAVIRRSLAR